ncbi:MAG: LytTR family DNA-binding domain-containing protein [Gemmiger sp.]|nr:LytTR family DNA-binding domain-containing protein [Gemmiger sp.]
MKILVCDDDAAFAGHLARLLQQYATALGTVVELCPVTDPATLADARLAMFDLAFLDVDMGAVSGIAVAKRLRALREDAVIVFVTNYIEYAPAGYEVQAFRYLIKICRGIFAPPWRNLPASTAATPSGWRARKLR